MNARSWVPGTTWEAGATGEENDNLKSGKGAELGLKQAAMTQLWDLRVLMGRVDGMDPCREMSRSLSWALAFFFFFSPSLSSPSPSLLSLL